MLKGVSGMVTQIGVLWMAFTIFTTGWVVLKQLETHAYLAILFSLLSCVYLGKVFLSFRSDLQKKIKDSNFNLIGSWTRLILDVLILVVLLQLSMKSFIPQLSSQAYILQYNKYGQLLLSLIFLFFRFVLQLMES